VNKHHFFRYIFIGIFNTITGYGITFYLFYLGTMAELSNFLGYAIGILLSYFLNKKYNFKSNNSHIKDFPKFAISMFTAYIVNLIILIIIFRYYELSFYLAQVLASVGYVLVGYILSKHYVFRER
jgi:putative flippase GtrA